VRTISRSFLHGNTCVRHEQIFKEHRDAHLFKFLAKMQVDDFIESKSPRPFYISVIKFAISDQRDINWTFRCFLQTWGFVKLEWRIVNHDKDLTDYTKQFNSRSGWFSGAVHPERRSMMFFLFVVIALSLPARKAGNSIDHFNARGIFATSRRYIVRKRSKNRNKRAVESSDCNDGSLIVNIYYLITGKSFRGN